MLGNFDPTVTVVLSDYLCSPFSSTAGGEAALWSVRIGCSGPICFCREYAFSSARKESPIVLQYFCFHFYPLNSHLQLIAGSISCQFFPSFFTWFLVHFPKFTPIVHTLFPSVTGIRKKKTNPLYSWFLFLEPQWLERITRSLESVPALRSTGEPERRALWLYGSSASSKSRVNSPVTDHTKDVLIKVNKAQFIKMYFKKKDLKVNFYAEIFLLKFFLTLNLFLRN